MLTLPNNDLPLPKAGSTVCSNVPGYDFHSVSLQWSERGGHGSPTSFASRCGPCVSRYRILDGTPPPGDLTLVAASKSFCHAFAIDPASVTDKEFRKLGAGEWNVPQLNSLLKATASGHAEVDGYEFDLCRSGQPDRRLVLNAQKLAYGNVSNIRLLVSVLDVTEALVAEKLKDDLLKEKAVLRQELQHRIANSLQIIASVLMSTNQGLRANNRAENSHQPIRRRKRKMQRFKSPHRFLFVHAAIDLQHIQFAAPSRLKIDAAPLPRRGCGRMERRNRRSLNREINRCFASCSTSRDNAKQKEPNYESTKQNSRTV